MDRNNMSSIWHTATANVPRLYRLLKNNAGDPAQVVREVISNASDAGATKLWLLPCPTPAELAGFIAVDNGSGLSSPDLSQDTSEQGEGRREPVDPVDRKGNYPGIFAFTDVALSTRDERSQDNVGFMGLGCKLLFEAKKRLLVITKCDDEDSYTYLEIMNPSEHFGAHQIFQTTNETLLKDLIKGRQEGHYGMRAVSDYAERYAAFEKSVLDPWLASTRTLGGHGTLIFVQGFAGGDFSDILDNFDLAIGEEDAQDFSRQPNINSPQGDDRIDLKTYMRFKTFAGNVLIRENLEKAGFDRSQLDHVELIRPIKSEGKFMTIHYLTKGNTRNTCERWFRIPDDQRFRLKTLPKGYAFLPVGDHSGPNSRPSTMTNIGNATFQARYITAFHHDGEPYVVLFAVDGINLRNKHYTMLDRSGGGGRRNHLLHSLVPLTVGDHSGVLLSAKGVPLANVTSVLSSDRAMKKFRDFATLFSGKYKQHATVFIDGNFPPTLDRTQVTAAAQGLITSDKFLEELSKAFEGAKGDAIIKELVELSNGENDDGNITNATKVWEAKMSKVLSQDRFVVKCPLGMATNPGSGSNHTTHHFITPQAGQEATVQAIYNILSGTLTEHHFREGGGIEDLIDYWPATIHNNGAEGLDAIGLCRRALLRRVPGSKGAGEINFPRIPEGIPYPHLKNIEFKVHFDVCDKDEDSSYNHPLLLTDLIVAQRLTIGGKPIQTPLRNDIKIYDDYGCVGQLCTEYTNSLFGEVIKVPECLEGHAYFITGLVKHRSGNEPAIQPHKRHLGHEAVMVVDLEALIKATFNRIAPAENRVDWRPAPRPASRPPPRSARSARSAPRTTPSSAKKHGRKTKTCGGTPTKRGRGR